jgi:hypothetical protein
MKSKFSLFALVIFSFAFSAATLGQASKVLVAGEPALTQANADAIVKYYERGLGLKLTYADRRELQGLIADNWRDALASGGADGLANYMKTVDTFNSWDDAKITRLQDKVREAVLGDLRGTAGNGGMSRFILDLYEERSGRENSVAGVEQDQPAANDAPTGGIVGLSAIVGTWVNGRSMTSVTNSIGVTSAGTGSRFTYKFFIDGTVEYTGIIQTVSYGGCRLVAFTQKKGKVSVSGGEMTISYAPAHFSRDDSCDRAGNYKKTLPAETVTQRFAVKEKYGDTYVCFAEKNGEESCFSKE